MTSETQDTKAPEKSREQAHDVATEQVATPSDQPTSAGPPKNEGKSDSDLKKGDADSEVPFDASIRVEVSKPEEPHQTWWQKNWVTMVGAVVPVFIAIVGATAAVLKIDATIMSRPKVEIAARTRVDGIVLNRPISENNELVVPFDRTIEFMGFRSTSRERNDNLTYSWLVRRVGCVSSNGTPNGTPRADVLSHVAPAESAACGWSAASNSSELLWRAPTENSTYEVMLIVAGPSPCWWVQSLLFSEMCNLTASKSLLVQVLRPTPPVIRWAEPPLEGTGVYDQLFKVEVYKTFDGLERASTAGKIQFEWRVHEDVVGRDASYNFKVEPKDTTTYTVSLQAVDSWGIASQVITRTIRVDPTSQTTAQGGPTQPPPQVNPGSDEITGERLVPPSGVINVNSLRAEAGAVLKSIASSAVARAADGSPGANGAAGGSFGASGLTGQDGDEGGSGSAGRSASKIEIVAMELSGALRVDASGAHGGVGGNGGRGGDGGPGAPGEPSISAIMGCAAGPGRGGDGGSGGAGGRGGDGGNGGNAGDVSINIQRLAPNATIEVVADGGGAGAPGLGGAGGNGGAGGPEGSLRGFCGPAGRAGFSGTPGRTGSTANPGRGGDAGRITITVGGTTVRGVGRVRFPSGN